MLDGRPLIDAHQHPVRLSTVKPAWMDWAERFGQPGWREAYTADGEIVPQAFGDLMQAEGVDHALVICEYSPKTTGMQPAEDLLPLTAHDPGRFSLVANINPHLHYPVDAELARQLALGAVALKVHPVHGGFSPADPALYPAYQACVTEGLPVVVHCGTSSFPGSSNELADPALLLPVLRDFPGLTVVLAHGGRGWWYDAAASLALLHENVWIELSGLPPQRLPHYNAFTSQADCRERVCREQIPLGSVPGVLMARLSGHRIMINGHALSPPLSFVAAIPVGPEPRSRWSTRSEARTTDWTVGGRWTRPPRSRNVADRRATASRAPTRRSERPGLSRRSPGEPCRSRLFCTPTPGLGGDRRRLRTGLSQV
jgi:hypothetical protein